MKVCFWGALACAALIVAATSSQSFAQRTSDGFGVTEWEEWGFANKDFWIYVAGDQGRSDWAGGVNMVAVADPDEWDDLNDSAQSGVPDSPDNYGTLNSQMKTPAIDVSGVGGTTGTLSFNSTWRPEFDSDMANQSANVSVIFDGGAPVDVIGWNSNSADADPGWDNSVNPDGRRLNTPGVGHGVDASGETAPGSGILNNPAADELVMASVDVPAGASSAMFAFNFFDGTNDWWWAVDNIDFSAGGSQLFFEDFESLASIASPNGGGGQIDEDWQGNFPATPPGTIAFNSTEAYTQTPPDGWELTPDYTGPDGSWANLNGQTVSAPGIDGNYPIVPEPGTVCLAVLGLAGLAALRRRA